MLRLQSGSEHEPTDSLTSLRCLAPVLRCMFCAETKHVLLLVSRCTRFELHSFVLSSKHVLRLVCGTGTAGWFCFPAVAGVFLQGSAGRFCPLSLVCSLLLVCSSVSLCLERDSEFEGEHISGGIRQYQVVIWNPFLAWEIRSRRMNRVLSETCTMHASWLRVQEIRRFVFAVSRVEKHAVLCLFLSLHTYPSSCLLFVSLGCAD